jgi:hypothetical protein
MSPSFIDIFLSSFNEFLLARGGWSACEKRERTNDDDDPASSLARRFVILASAGRFAVWSRTAAPLQYAPGPP